MNSYPWFIDNWLSSRTRMRLSPLARCVYRELIDQCWKHGSLPKDEKILAKMSLVSDKEFRAAWREIEELFVEKNGELHHETVDEKRPQLVEYKERQAEFGRKGAEARRKAPYKAPYKAPLQEPLSQPSSDPSRVSLAPIPIPIRKEGEYTASEQDARAARNPLPLTQNEPDPTAAFADAARYACEQLPAGGDLPMTIAAITSAYQQSASYLDRPIDFAESIRRAVASWRDAYRANRHLRPKPAQWWLRDGTFALSVPQGPKGTEDPIWAEELRLRALEAKNGH
ncbi:MAG: DUF1376 domain-containing protein [Acidobacteriota bacterium]|jgi:uncharacterized protein YdaU (DUF1376 family)